MPDITDEQLKAFEAAVAKATELETLKGTAEAKLKEYENDQAMVNWRKSRETMSRMKEALKASGKNVDDDGNVLETPSSMSVEEVRKMAREEARQEMVERAVGKARNGLNDADKVIFDKAYSKAAYGEVVDAETVESVIDSAMKMATSLGGMTSADRSAGTRGGAPRLAGEGEQGFGDTDAGKELAARMGLKIA